jgi:hypothetical protein
MAQLACVKRKKIVSPRPASLHMFELVSLCAVLLSTSGCDPLEIIVPRADASIVAPSEKSATVIFPGRVGETERFWTPFEEEAQAGVKRPILPLVLLNYTYPTVTGRTIKVAEGGNLQSALNNARRGDEIVLAAGATFTGNFVLRNKGGSVADGWIILRSEGSTRLPAQGTRVSPGNSLLMSTIMTPNVNAAISTEAGASGWWLSGLEITVSPALNTLAYGLVSLGEVGRKQSTIESVPTDIVLDRLYIHAQTTTNILRCVALNSARTQITDSYLADCHAKGYDSQAIWGGNGPGPYKIVNNMLQGAGENVMFGGDDPSIPGLVPSDIEFRRNFVYTPLAWQGVWTRKNLLETKNVARFLIEDNVFDGSWKDAQGGMAIVLRSSNQSGGCRWCRTTDVTIRRNLIRNSGGGIGFVGTGDNVAGTDTTARRILVSETVIDGLSTGSYQGSDPRAFMFMNGVTDITIERTVVTGNLLGAMWVDKRRPALRTSFRNNVIERGKYGIGSDGLAEGNDALARGTPGAIWQNNSIIGAARGSYPPGTQFVPNERAAPIAATIRQIVAKATSGVDIP